MFDLMEGKAAKLIGKKVAFKEIRRKADATLRVQLQGPKDLTIDDIYQEIGRVLELDTATTDQLKQLELDFEMRMLCKRASVVNVAEHAYAIGKRVVLASDMYLTETHLRTLLEKLDIKAYHKIYISADVGHRKDRRTLFPYILESEGVAPEALLHVGDNEHSDLQIPGDLGITVFHVKRAKDLFLRSHLGKHVYRHRYHTIPPYYRGCIALAINKFYDDPFPKKSLTNADLELFGYYYFGPLLLSYVKWVADTAKSQHIKRLYFISRDGEILYKIYQLLQSRSRRSVPEAAYIEVSRRALAIPFIKDHADVDKALNANFFGDTLQHYLHARLGIDITGINPKRLQKYGFETVNDPVYIPADLEKVKPLAYAVYNENKSCFEEDKEKAIRYLQEKGLFDKTKKSIVDIGYSGTMQRLLNRITRRPIHGLYMVTYNTIRTQITQLDVITKGLFADGIDPFSEAPTINKYSLFYEMVLSSVNGPVERYKETESGIQPIYEPVSPDEEGKLQKMPLIHKGIMDFCTDFANRFDGFDLVDYKDVAILQEAFAHFIEHPTAEDVTMLAGYTLDDHYCGNGVFYWVPPLETLQTNSYNPQKCLWQNGINVLLPGNKKLAEPVNGTANRLLETPLDKQIFDWYAREYEALPDWYKKVGHVVKLLTGKKRLRIVVEDTRPATGHFKTKAEEIQAWYDKEYEATPGWFKKFGHVIKVIYGKKKLNEYL
jgi:predicted HAD superfamily hydrolase